MYRQIKYVSLIYLLLTLLLLLLLFEIKPALTRRRRRMTQIITIGIENNNEVVPFDLNLIEESLNPHTKSYNFFTQVLFYISRIIND